MQLRHLNRPGPLSIEGGWGLKRCRQPLENRYHRQPKRDATRSPSSALLNPVFGWEGSPAKIDYRKRGTLRTLEDLVKFLRTSARDGGCIDLCPCTGAGRRVSRTQQGGLACGRKPEKVPQRIPEFRRVKCLPEAVVRGYQMATPYEGLPSPVQQTGTEQRGFADAMRILFL